MSWIKIDNELFETKSESVQFSIGSHATISVSFDIDKNPNYLDHFIKIYEGNHSLYPNKMKFDIEHTNFIGRGTMIKSMDTDFGKIMNIDFRCDILEVIDKQERREDRIESILDKTLLNNKDIN